MFRVLLIYNFAHDIHTFLSRYGYGSRPLEPEGPSLCTLGSGDFLASDDGAESFMAL